MNRELLQQALDVIDTLRDNIHHAMSGYEYESVINVIEALKAELEKPEPEPVGWATVAQLKRGAFMEGATPPSFMNGLIPLYTKGTP